MIGAGILGYLIGSLPLGFLAGRRLAGVDLRRVGSGNVGATNMYRVSGLRLGLAVMAIDLVKGAAAVLVAARAGAADLEVVTAGVAAVAGHVYPVWLKGRGGKGVATACGAFAILAPAATLAAAVAFGLTVWATGIVSLGSVAASVTLPIAAGFTPAPPGVAVGAAVTAALVIWRHRGNLSRLREGTERGIARGGRDA
ncbi:MAG: glycerol-3-phosphate 1-O-acyltransferase PlsY [Vicinamibacterales bacterium]